MIFRLLGDLEVLIDGQDLRLAGHKQRALLAVLLLHANEVVGADRLIEDLWGDEPPAQAAKSVQVHVWRLRKALGAETADSDADGRVLTRASGYVLRVDRGELDVQEFERLVDEGSKALRDGQPERAGGLLREGLALWRGPPLAEFAYDAFARQEIERLSELHSQAIQGRIDADLALGRHDLLVGELEALVAAHPLAERLRGQLMLALYRSGRQADALEVYRQTRQVLLDDLGLEPGKDLKRLHAAILSHDPELELPPAADPSSQPVMAGTVDVHGARAAPPWGAQARAHRRWGLPVAAVLLLSVAAAAAVVILETHGGGAVIAAANSVAVIDPGDNRVVTQTPVGAGPGSITAGIGGVWVANTDDHTIMTLDVASRQVTRTMGFRDSVDGVAADSRALWTVDSTRGIAQRIDPTFRTVVRTVPVGDRAGSGSIPNALAVGGNAVWVANNASGITWIADGGTRVSRTDVGNEPSGIAIGGGATWVADDFDNTVSRIDSTGGISKIIPVGRGASGIVVGAGAVWVASTLDDRLERIDPTTNSVTTTIRVGSRPRGVAWGDGSIWVANSGDGTISRVDPGTDRVRRIAVGQSPQAIVVTGGAVWVSVAARAGAGASPATAPSGLLRVAGEGQFASTDPALIGGAPDFQAPQLYHATCAGLLTYPDRPGPDGTRLVPEVARALPSVSADGRTYTFTIRPGFRFSPPSGAPVTAATFKHTIERTLSPRLKAYARSFMGDIVGMPAYQASRAAHLAGVSADGDRLRIRLAAPAPDLPARLASPAFCAVPDDAPATVQSRPLPAAGPYYAISSSRDELVLARNPNYAGHRARNPSRIVYSFGVPFARAVKQIAAGESDYLSALAFPDAPASVALARQLARRYGPGSAPARRGRQQYFTNPWPGVDYFAFNTARPLFASRRLRRAVNYAIDRRSLVRHGFLFNGGQAFDHYLPPGIPGAPALGVYPLGTPDLAKARRLAAGLHARATMYTCNWAPQCLEAAQILRTDLRAIGITTDIRAFPTPLLYRRLARRAEPWDIAFMEWGADFADPSNFINSLFDPASQFNYGRFDDPSLTERMRRAATLGGDHRLRAYARLDEELARRDAPVAAWATDANREFFSARVGCQIYQPIYGTDLGSLCLRP